MIATEGLKLIEGEHTSKNFNLNVMLDGRKIVYVLLGLAPNVEVAQVNRIFVEREERSTRLMGHVLLDTLKILRRKFGVLKMDMYKDYPELRAESEDSWVSVARTVIGLRLERRYSENKFYVSMLPTARQNHERLYTAERLEMEGYTFLSWAQCDAGIRQQIEGLRDEIEEEGRWLPTDYPDCDADLTLIAFYRGEICGWMIFKRLSDDEAECLRWYALKKYRSISAGVKLSGHFFRHVLEHCSKLQFSVRLEDEAPMKFYRQFFKGVIEKIEYGYKYYWSLKDGNK